MIARRSSKRMLVLVATLAVFLVSLMITFQRTRELENDVASAVNAAIWTLAQTEIEYYRLLNALQAYQAGDPAVDGAAVAERFEIFWSRVPVLIDGPEVRPLRNIIDLEARLDPIMETLRLIEPMVFSLARDDEQSFTAIYDALAPMGPSLHQLVVDAHWQQDWQRIYRADEGQSLRLELAVSFAGIIMSGGILITLLIREIRETERLLRQSNETEAELVKTRNAAEQANTAKSRFLAAANHDLRQPLQALSMLLAILQRTTDWHHRRAIYGQMTSKLETIGNMLNVLLDIGKLEEGRVQVNFKDVPLAEHLARLENEFRLPAEKAGLELRFVPTRTVVRSDPILLERITANLVSNAVRYTNQGKILVGCRRRGNRVCLEIWDTGPGIEADKLSEIFQDYTQLANPSRDPARGLGLGLAIVERLAKLMEHKITVRSTPGKGSMFAIELPFVLRSQPERVTRPVARQVIDVLDKATIILIEDDETMLATGTRLLRMWGARVISGPNSETVLERLKGQRARPDIVIADYRLANRQTGLETIQEIKDFLGRDIPSIVMTGDTDPEVTTEIEASGSALAHKPFNPVDLEALIAKLITRSPCVPTAPADHQEASAAKSRIRL